MLLAGTELLPVPDPVPNTWLLGAVRKALPSKAAQEPVTRNKRLAPPPRSIIGISVAAVPLQRLTQSPGHFVSTDDTPCW